MVEPKVAPDLVRHSIAGTAFHYRWAARRCLRMIDPASPVRLITVEGSLERNKAGEYVIDLAEYGQSSPKVQTIAHYQLKHSTVRIDKEFGFDDAKKTLAGFAARFVEGKKGKKAAVVSFTLVTNRRVSKKLMDNLQVIRDGKKPSPGFLKSLQGATKLKGAKLQAFCSRFSLIDGQGDYIAQKRMLRGEMAECIAGFNEDGPEIESLIALVNDRALPKSENPQRLLGEIFPEDVLQRLNAPSGLFPSRPSFGEVPNVFEREGHAALVDEIVKHPGTAIIHAEGGVGKTIVAQQLAKSLPHGSQAVLYDCFGSGSYRNASSPRHRACDGLVQMANELAASGYSGILIGNSQSAPDALFRKFIERLGTAAGSLKQINSKALLVLIVDAGDNAQMEAKERGEAGFVKPLLAEKLPASCRLVVLSRTERLEYLSAPSTARLHLLQPFSLAETARHLHGVFPQATDHQVQEFHRLTSRNPRIQANALKDGGKPLQAVLHELGPSPTTLDGLIAKQLQLAIDQIRDASPSIAKANIDSICTGLATLPPMVPLKVLAAVAKVKVANIKSFVSDIGRPLWHSDDSIQFLDEPTETWFRLQFCAKPHQLKAFVKTLEPLAAEFTYVAKALPKLLLQSGQLEKLVALALSNESLPEGKPIDERDVRVYRLRFAFRAALQMGRRADAMRLAFRAGEEVAGNQRQFEILSDNLDLIAPLQDQQRIQELALNRTFLSGWLGSENLYSAALLSSVPDFKGEAISFLRSTHRWLQNFFELRKSQPKQEFPHDDPLTDGDVLELIWTHYNLDGPTVAAQQLLRWRPPRLVFDVARKLARRVVDAGRLADLDLMAKAVMKNPYFIVALAEECSGLQLLPATALKSALDALLTKKNRIPREEGAPSRRPYVFAIVSFAEACASRGLPRKQILSLLRFYTSPVADRSVGDDTHSGPRETFVRAMTLDSVLSGDFSPDINKMIPAPPGDGKKQDRFDQRSAQEIRESLEILLPWYLLRARLICRDPSANTVDLEAVHQQTRSTRHKRQYRSYDRMPFEATRGWFKVLALKTNVTSGELKRFSDEAVVKAERKFTLDDRLAALRIAYRLPHLRGIQDKLETSCRITIELPGSRPEDDAEFYIKLARALLPISAADAAVYFGNAVMAVSKFGDEKTERWEAVVAVAARAALKPKADAEKSTYRFLRCGEMVEADVTRDRFENRDNVFNVSLRLHPSGTFAALSRWRDRAVGDFPAQLRTVAHEAVSLDKIKASTAWSLTGFLGCRASGTFAAACIGKASSQAECQRLFRSACEDFKLEGAALRDWRELEAIAKEHELDGQAVAEMIAQLQPTPRAPHRYDRGESESKEARKYREFLKGKDATDPKELESILDWFEKTPFPHSPQTLWDLIVETVPRGKEKIFLNVLPVVSNVDHMDAGSAITAIRNMWSQRAAVRQEWPNFLKAIGRRFAIEFSNHYRFYGWLEMNSIDDQALKSLKAGLVDGFSDFSESMDAAAFFGFVRYAAEDLPPNDAHDVLGYALERFEQHMEPDCGDGPWASWLKAPAALADSVSGFLWSALGSPYGVVRWQAAHCVRRLAANHCTSELKSLVCWLRKGTTDAFGGHKLPFYALHSRLYLMFAFSRAAYENPKSILAFAKDIAAVALSGLPHALIQKLAATTSLTLESACPGTFARNQMKKLERVGVSPFAVVEQNPRDRTPRSLSHGVLAKAKDHMHFGIDFGPYWFQYLGHVFDLSEDDITGRVSEVAKKDLKIIKGDGYLRDPRTKQWNSLYSHRKGTSHSHGSYPFIDDFTFYVAYHSLMSVGARLVTKMPTVRSYRDDDDPWPDWLRGHMLTRRDGRWLADRRDPTPLKQRAWTEKQVTDTWRWELKRDDFLDVIWKHEPLSHPICVHGQWVEMKDGYTERIVISSALVDPAHSSDIAAKLRACFHHEQQPLPPFDGPSEDWSDGKVTGWVRNPWSDPKLDQFDPLARRIKYPPRRLTKEVASALGLTSDAEGRCWVHSGRVEVIDEIWGDEDIMHEEQPYRWGERMNASVVFLKRLCRTLAKDLLIKVEISRNRPRHYETYSEDREGYIPPSHNVFVLSASGFLSDGRTQHKL